MYYRQAAISVRRERIARRGIITGAIYTLANWDSCDHFPGLVIGDGHHTTAASAKQAVVSRVDRHGNRVLTANCRPPPPSGGGLSVDLADFGRIGEVSVKFAVSGCRTIFGLSAELD